MKAGLRLGMLAFAAGLWLGSPALAQSTQTVPQNSTQSAPPPTTNPPPATTVGPRELQNFSIGGTVTRPAEAPPAANAPAPSTQAPAQAPTQAPATRRQTAPPGSSAATRNSAPEPSVIGSRQVQAAPPQLNLTTSSPAPAPTVAAPPASDTFAPVPETTPTALPSDHRNSMLPWLLAAAALAGGVGFLLWRRRPREAVAGPALDAYVPPAPAPAPAPTPKVAAPEPAPAATGFVTTQLRAAPAPAADVGLAPVSAPSGVVAARLRPWLEITLVPVACRVEDELITFDFEIDIFNSGSAAARDVRIQATLFNAGPTQEQDIGAFMARPSVDADPLAPIPPLQRATFRSSLQAQRASIQLFEVAGRQLFVPIVAFNAVYRWSGGGGQSSGSYMIGRETGAEKLAPLRADLGSRAFGGLGARPLPTSVRQ